TSARASAGSAPRGCRWLVLAAKWPATRSTSLPDEEARRHHRVSQQRLLRGCVAYIQRCRSAASAWQPLRDPAAKPPPNRRPLWLPLHCRVGAAGCPAAPLTEPDLRASHPALWIVVSEDQIKLVRDFHRRI